MSLSVVIRSKDEADRLRLTLTSLSRQSHPAEVIVVNDGSSDHTPAVLEEAAHWLPLTVIHHPVSKGRSQAANAGATAAKGRILLFLDGDTLAGPQWAERHAAVHAGRDDVIGRGENYHLRCTRFLLDPETGSARPEAAARLERMPAAEREALRVTRRQILEDFAAVTRRAEVGIYPGAAARRLQELELQALRDDPDCSVIWAAACGSNLSVPREAFLAAGGFNPEIDINEHRELALRLMQRGLRMTLAQGANSYHLTHRSGWRDPLVDTRWEDVFFAAHPIRAVPLLAVFWASVSESRALRPEDRIESLAALERASQEAPGMDFGAARLRLGLAPLPYPGALS